jgi:hypothetical protein
MIWLLKLPSWPAKGKGKRRKKLAKETARRLRTPGRRP